MYPAGCGGSRRRPRGVVRIRRGSPANPAWPIGRMPAECAERRSDGLFGSVATVPPTPRRSARPPRWHRRQGAPGAPFPGAGACRGVNSGACGVPSGRRRTSPARNRPNRCDQGCRPDWWPYAGRCRGNRWGTDSCQRRQRRRNVHVVPDTSEESASLALSAVQYRFLGPPLHPHPIPAGTVRACLRQRPPSRFEFPSRPPGGTPLPPPRTALPWLRRNTRP